MKSRLKWMLFSLAAPMLVACNSDDANTPASDSSDQNQPPIAATGDNQNVSVGDVVKLDGKKSSDKDGDLITYRWSIKTKPEGSQASLNKSDTVAPEFTADLAGTYVIELVVNDGKSDSKTVSVDVLVAPVAVNSPPVVNAGKDKTYAIGETIQLTGSATDADGDPLTHQWTIIQSPDNSTPTLTNSDQITATLNASAQGSYVLTLTVSDKEVSVEDTVTVTLEPANVAPVAVAGVDVDVVIGSTARLDGRGSRDGNNDALLYEWAFVSKPENSMADLDNVTSETPSFIPDLTGEYVLSLTVSDGELTSAPSNVKITVVEANSGELKLVFDGETTPKSWPFALEPAEVQVTINEDPLPAAYKVGSFTLEAVGMDYTVKEVIAMDVMDSVIPYVVGVQAGQVIKAGESVTVDLMSPLTGGTQVMLSFGVTIAENSDYYMSASYFFTSN